MSKRRNRRRKADEPSIQEQNFWSAVSRLDHDSTFWHMVETWEITFEPAPEIRWATVAYDGSIRANSERLASVEEWEYVLAHCYLHLGLGHFRRRTRWREWSLACDCMVRLRLDALRIGRAPEEFQSLPDGPDGAPAKDEESLYRRLCEGGAGLSPVYSLSGSDRPDMLEPDAQVTDKVLEKMRREYESKLALGIQDAVREAVEIAGGLTPRRPWESGEGSEPCRAKSWCMASYPLLGALAANFEIIEDAKLCARMDVSIAAVNESARELYFNPAAGLDRDETRFVMAHELLHVALRHQGRTQGRDPYLWNVACDFAINAWLIEMRLGSPPQVGLLYDPELKGLSAETIYDRVVKDLRVCRRLRTLRGKGKGDMLGPSDRVHGTADLDDFYRGCLARGVQLHEAQGRGLLPSGLAEEIRAQMQPPVPWDVRLARWFDQRFALPEMRRSYARASRRQAATPDIFRPGYIADPDTDQQRTFGVVLDTSGSMGRVLLARALGAIAGFAAAKKVPAARVVFCDAQAYDAGYMPTEAIADRVQVRGRGGTVLQPGVDLLERAPDFPPNGPILIITDGWCDAFRVRRDHAVLVPAGMKLPFPVRGEVFQMEAR